MRERRLLDIKERHELTYADLASVLSQDVDELEPYRVTERLCHLGHPQRLVAQIAGGALAVLVVRVLYPDVTPEEAADVVVPHLDDGATAEGPIEEPVPGQATRRPARRRAGLSQNRS